LAKKESRFLLTQLGVVLAEERSFLPNRAMRDIPTPLYTETGIPRMNPELASMVAIF